MRTVGVAILGIFSGLIAGFLIFSEIIGRLVIDNGTIDAPWTFIIGFGPQILALAGGVIAVVIDNKYRERSAR